MLNLEWLHAFVVFSQHMNFTRAARALHLSQPALHVQIGKLSSALGVPLYRRKGQALELTADGRRVLGFGRDLDERTSAFLDDLQMRGSHRPVVLCAGEGAYLYLLGEAVRSFLDARPAPLRLLTRDRDGTIEAVQSGEAHLGVASLGSGSAPPDLEVEELTEVGSVLVVPSDHRLAGKRAVHLADLDGERLVVPGPARPHRTTLAQALDAAGVSWEIGVEANGWELMLRFVELGAGIAVVNSCCRIPGGLVARPLPELPARSYELLRRPGAATTGAAAELRRTLIALRDAWKRGAPPATPRPGSSGRKSSRA